MEGGGGDSGGGEGGGDGGGWHRVEMEAAVVEVVRVGATAVGAMEGAGVVAAVETVVVAAVVTALVKALVTAGETAACGPSTCGRRRQHRLAAQRRRGRQWERVTERPRRQADARVSGVVSSSTGDDGRIHGPGG